MQKKFKTLLVAAATSAAIPLSANADTLKGDVGLACEAILCLSSATRPGECAKSLQRYFSINLKRPHRTISARKSFLNLCPASKEPHMPQLINTLANGAGRCDAAELNRVMIAQETKRVCDTGWYHQDSGPNCRTETISYVRNDKPSYCSAYFNHEWTTVGDKVRFVGVEKEGGRWVDMK